MDEEDTHEEGKATKRSHTLGTWTWRDIAERTLPVSKALVRLCKETKKWKRRVI